MVLVNKVTKVVKMVVVIITKLRAAGALELERCLQAVPNFSTFFAFSTWSSTRSQVMLLTNDEHFSHPLASTSCWDISTTLKTKELPMLPNGENHKQLFVAFAPRVRQPTFTSS